MGEFWYISSGMFYWAWRDTKPGTTNKGLLYKRWFTHAIAPSRNKLITGLSPQLQSPLCFPTITGTQVNVSLTQLVPPGENQAAFCLALHPRPAFTPLPRSDAWRTWQKGTQCLSERWQVDRVLEWICSISIFGLGSARRANTQAQGVTFS